MSSLCMQRQRTSNRQPSVRLCRKICTSERRAACLMLKADCLVVHAYADKYNTRTVLAAAGECPVSMMLATLVDTKATLTQGSTHLRKWCTDTKEASNCPSLRAEQLLMCLCPALLGTYLVVSCFGGIDSSHDHSYDSSTEATDKHS